MLLHGFFTLSFQLSTIALLMVCLCCVFVFSNVVCVHVCVRGRGCVPHVLKQTKVNTTMETLFQHFVRSIEKLGAGICLGNKLHCHSEVLTLRRFFGSCGFCFILQIVSVLSNG